MEEKTLQILTKVKNGELTPQIAQEQLFVLFGVSGCFTKEDLQAAFSAGRKFETGEQDSEKTYNKFTGYQEPNRELDFEKWYELNYR